MYIRDPQEHGLYRPGPPHDRCPPYDPYPSVSRGFQPQLGSFLSFCCMCVGSRFFFLFFFFSFLILFVVVVVVLSLVVIVLVFLTISNFLPSTFHHSTPAPFEFRSQICSFSLFCRKIDDLLCCVLMRSVFVCCQLCVAALGFCFCFFWSLFFNFVFLFCFCLCVFIFVVCAYFFTVFLFSSQHRSLPRRSVTVVSLGFKFCIAQDTFATLSVCLFLFCCCCFSFASLVICNCT